MIMLDSLSEDKMEVEGAHSSGVSFSVLVVG